MLAWRAVFGLVLTAWVALGCRASEPVPDAARRSLPRDAVAVERACGPVAPVCPAAAPEPVGLDSVPAWSRIREIAARPAAEIDVAEVSLQIAANVKGRAAAIRVDLGARVRKGEAILEIESVDLGRAREELLRELSSLRVSSRAYERAKKLVEARAISTGEFQSREGDYLAKRAAAQAAERALHLYGVADEEIATLKASVETDGTLPSGHDAPRLVLRAPFDGRVIDRKVTPGSLFEALQPLVTVADLSSVWVFLQAYEKDLALLHEGVTVTIRTEAFPQDTFEGRVDFLGSVVDS